MDKKTIIFCVLFLLIGIFIGSSVTNLFSPGQGNEYYASLDKRVSWIETSLSSCSACGFKPEPIITGDNCVCYSNLELSRSTALWNEEDEVVISLCRKQIIKDNCLDAEYAGVNVNCRWSC